MSQSIFFTHANGFPSATYGKLFEGLAPDFCVEHLAVHGHDPRFPVGDNWQALVEELLHHLEARGEPVWGVGHSLGGLLHYHAAHRRPDLYRGVVMLDAPVLSLRDRLAIRLAKGLGMIDRVTPAGRTLGRRQQFSDAAEARGYFAGKTLFRGFDPDCLDAYVEHGLEPAGEGLRLRFNPATEIAIFRNVPHVSPGQPQRLKVPLAMIYGEQSGVVRPHHARLLVQVPQAQCLSLPGGHMFPLERPHATADLVRQVLARWANVNPKESA